MKGINTVLFDLDGTLLDTALDLGHALNRLLQEEGKAPLPQEIIRRVVSNGGNAMVSLGFATEPEDPIHQRLYKRLLELYGDQLALHTQPFPGIETLLATIEQLEMQWGIVTNKPCAYTLPLLAQIPLQPEYGTVICPDDVTRRKPHPEPIYLACKRIGCRPSQAIYVGDHRRDIESGKNAGMMTVAATYGYIPEGENPYDWDADYYIDHPDQLTELLHLYHS